MIVRKMVVMQKAGSPYTSQPCTPEQADKWIKLRREQYPAEVWMTFDSPSCLCCGEPAWSNLRCTKHQDRNPCLVAGCTKTTKANGHLATYNCICGPHWRLWVPPGSRERRAYNAHRRRAKRFGWDADTAAAFDRFWDTLAQRVARLSTEFAQPALDEAKIREMFGWAED